MRHHSVSICEFSAHLELLLEIIRPSGQNFIDRLFIDFDDFDDFSDWRDGGDASGEDNVISALEHIDRICDVRLNVTGSELEEISTVMQEPFLALTTSTLSLEI